MITAISFSYERRQIMWRSPFSGALFLLMMLWSVTLGAAGSDHAPDSPITATRIKERVYFLADETLEGRYPGSQGYRIAAAYVSSQLRAAGLQPLQSLSDTGSYLQPVPLCLRTVSDAAVVTLHTPDGSQSFAAGNLKLFLPEGLVHDPKPLPVVFAGFGISEPSAGWDDLAGLDIEGKIVVILLGAPAIGEEPVLPGDLHRAYAPMNSILRKLLTARRAAALLVLVDSDLREAYESLPDYSEEPQLILDDSDTGAFGGPTLGFLSVELSSSLFADQRFPDIEAVSSRALVPGLLPGVTMSIQVPFTDEQVPTWNVIGLVPGTDPLLKDQYVVVSAHLDHLRPTADGRIHPGANDNASGAAALLEIAGVLAQHPLKRSVLCVFFTAEEGGSMGSRHFLAHCPVPRQQIVANVNMDMIGRTEEGLESGRDQYVLDSGRVTPAFTRLIEEVNTTTISWSLRFEHPRNIGNSDHYVFDALDIPAVNFYTGKIPDTHQPTDTADKLDYDKAAAIARLVCAVVEELGNREQLW
jgi:hypothetical protein